MLQERVETTHLSHRPFSGSTSRAWSLERDVRRRCGGFVRRICVNHREEGNLMSLWVGSVKRRRAICFRPYDYTKCWNVSRFNDEWVCGRMRFTVENTKMVSNTAQLLISLLLDIYQTSFLHTIYSSSTCLFMSTNMTTLQAISNPSSLRLSSPCSLHSMSRGSAPHALQRLNIHNKVRY
jgi:hypothetical protein